MRNYELMRLILFEIRNAKSSSKNGFSLTELNNILKDTLNSREDLVCELKRLKSEGLIEGNMEFSGSDDNVIVEGNIKYLSENGIEFIRLIEQPDVWKICLTTLKNANIDLSYPFLKEICEEIVRRYVMSKIPNFD